jgi:rSAM/selenodomain-associated transferase 2
MYPMHGGNTKAPVLAPNLSSGQRAFVLSGEMRMKKDPTLAVIVPVRNEAQVLAAGLAPLLALPDVDELIVVDGQSTDGSLALAAGLLDTTRDGTRACCLSSGAGRARQMNAGASNAGSDVLLFLHIDTRLPPQALACVRAAVAAGHVWGRFDVRLPGRHPVFRLIERAMSWRSRLTGIATGDQAIFVRADVFRMLGGFPDQPLMEDIELSRRLKWVGPPACLHETVETSSRRWERYGVVRTILLMWYLRLLYGLGVSPRRLARRYR